MDMRAIDDPDGIPDEQETAAILEEIRRALLGDAEPADPVAEADDPDRAD
ncbi:hypothetical protein [Sphingomonas sp. CV7422]|nr:hypothetical protein [Sphingomonas sp. CV7422]